MITNYLATHPQIRLYISIFLSMLLLIFAFVLFNVPQALSRTLLGSQDSEKQFADVSDIRYDVAFFNDALVISLDEAAGKEAQDVAAEKNVTVTLESVADIAPELPDNELVFVATLFDANGNVIAVAEPNEAIPVPQFDFNKNRKTVVGFSFTLSKEQISNWSSYEVQAQGSHITCSVPPLESQNKVNVSKSTLPHLEEEAARLETEKAEKAAADERASQEAQLKSGNIPTRSSYDGDYSDTLLIGDSIMVFTSSATRSVLPGVTIDAVSGRSLEEGGPNEQYSPADGVLDHVRGCDRSFERYVIGTGNNDGGGMSQADAEEIIANLDGKQIWFVTEYVSNNSYGTANTNSTIDVMCSKYSNVHKIDWYSLVSAHDEWLCGDNCHPQMAEGCEAYATIVKNALDLV